MGAEPTARLHTVAIDLRHDWPAALRAAGFDAAAATAWSAEGLLAFLPSDAQDRLLDNITALSAPGSRLITENMSGRDGAATAMQDRMRETVDRWRAHGFDVEMTDLWYLGDRHDVADYLNARGWTTDQTTMADLFAQYGQTLAGSADETADFGSFTYVTATGTETSQPHSRGESYAVAQEVLSLEAKTFGVCLSTGSCVARQLTE